VSRAMADRFWPGMSVVGKRFRFASGETYYEVVGVAADAVVRSLLDDAAPVAWLALSQNTVSPLYVNLRAEAGSTDAVVGAVRARMRELDSSLAVSDERVVAAVLDEGLWAPRAGASLLGLFALLALVLGGIGVYSVLSFAVRRRTQEVGIRLVLGASRRQLYRLLVGRGMAPALAGLALGVVGGAFFARSAADLLYRVSPLDAPTFATAAFVLFGVALLGCYLPVRRAVSRDPMEALRGD